MLRDERCSLTGQPPSRQPCRGIASAIAMPATLARAGRLTAARHQAMVVRPTTRPLSADRQQRPIPPEVALCDLATASDR